MCDNCVNRDDQQVIMILLVISSRHKCICLQGFSKTMTIKFDGIFVYSLN